MTALEKKLVLKTTYKKLSLKYQDNARFHSLCLVSENAFWSYFYSKNDHNSSENSRIGKKNKLVKLVGSHQGMGCPNDHTGKKFTLALKTTCKKVFLKYQVNEWFPSLCLASENAIFGCGKRRRKKSASS